MTWIINNKAKEFQLPKEGIHCAVLGAIENIGVVRTRYGEKEKARLVWIVDEIEHSTGKPLLAIQTLNASMHETAKLYQTIATATGSKPKPNLDVHSLVGTQARLVISHFQGDFRTYANIDSVHPPLRGQQVEIPRGWEPPQPKPKAALFDPEVFGPDPSNDGTSTPEPRQPREDPPAEETNVPYQPTDEDIPI